MVLKAVISLSIPTRDNLMANRTLLFKLIVITFFTSRLALGNELKLK